MPEVISITKKQCNPKFVGVPTPPEVLKAIEIIQEHLKKGWWVQAIIDADGGAQFRLDDIYDIIFALDNGYTTDESD